MLMEERVEPWIAGVDAVVLEVDSAGAEEEEARTGSCGLNPQINLGHCLLVACGAP